MDVPWTLVESTVRSIRQMEDELVIDLGKIGFVVVREELTGETVRLGSARGICGFLQAPISTEDAGEALMNSTGVLTPGKQDILKVLQQWKFFNGYSSRDLLELVHICPIRNIEKGDYLFHEGDAGKSLYVVLDRHLEVNRIRKGRSRVIDSVESGETVGELAILDDQQRSADVLAIQDTVALEINRTVWAKAMTPLASKCFTASRSPLHTGFAN